jgi:hypothetical protein
MFDDDSIPEWMQPLRNAALQSVPPHLHQQSQPKPFGETPGFVRLPEGISPVMGAHNEGLQLPVPGAPPPGILLITFKTFLFVVNDDNSMIINRSSTFRLTSSSCSTGTSKNITTAQLFLKNT